MADSKEATASNTITILYFAGAQTATRTPSETLKLPVAGSADSPGDDNGLPLSALAAILMEKYAGTNLASILLSSQWSVDAEMVENPGSVKLRGGEEVAIIPPVSGG